MSPLQVLEHLQAHDYQVMPWRNGKGTTTEIARDRPSSPHSSTDFLWRISIAKVSEAGDFSSFLGYQRIIMQLSGPALCLQHLGPGAPLTPVTLKVLEPHVFSGDWATHASFPTSVGANFAAYDFNVITRRDACTAKLQVLQLAPGAEQLLNFAVAGKEARILLYLLTGNVQISSLASSHWSRTLNEPETLIIGAADAASDTTNEKPALICSSPSGAQLLIIELSSPTV